MHAGVPRRYERMAAAVALLVLLCTTHAVATTPQRRALVDQIHSSDLLQPAGAASDNILCNSGHGVICNTGPGAQTEASRRIATTTDVHSFTPRYDSFSAAAANTTAHGDQGAESISRRLLATAAQAAKGVAVDKQNADAVTVGSNAPKAGEGGTGGEFHAAGAANGTAASKRAAAKASNNTANAQNLIAAASTAEAGGAGEDYSDADGPTMQRECPPLSRDLVAQHAIDNTIMVMSTNQVLYDVWGPSWLTGVKVRACDVDSCILAVLIERIRRTCFSTQIDLPSTCVMHTGC